MVLLISDDNNLISLNLIYDVLYSRNLEFYDEYKHF